MNRILIFLTFSLYFLAVTCVVSSHPTKEQAEKYVVECQKEHGVTEMDMEGIDFSANSPEQLKVIPRNVKCYTKCLLEKWGTIDRDGKIIKHSVKVELDENQQAYDECINKLDDIDDLCELSFRIMGCVDRLDQ